VKLINYLGFLIIIFFVTNSATDTLITPKTPEIVLFIITLSVTGNMALLIRIRIIYTAIEKSKTINVCFITTLLPNSLMVFLKI
jgi:hypothetical protein